MPCARASIIPRFISIQRPYKYKCTRLFRTVCLRFTAFVFPSSWKTMSPPQKKLKKVESKSSSSDTEPESRTMARFRWWWIEWFWKDNIRILWPPQDDPGGMWVFSSTTHSPPLYNPYAFLSVLFFHEKLKDIQNHHRKEMSRLREKIQEASRRRIREREALTSEIKFLKKIVGGRSRACWRRLPRATLVVSHENRRWDGGACNAGDGGRKGERWIDADL